MIFLIKLIASLPKPWLFKCNCPRLITALLMLLLSVTLSCIVGKCQLTLLILSEALALSVLKIKLEMQTLQSGKAFSTNAFKDKSLSNTILDVTLAMLFVPIFSIIFFWHFFNRSLMYSYMSSIVAPRKDSTLTFLQWWDILFSSIPDTMITDNQCGVFTSFVMVVISQTDNVFVPLSDCTSCFLVALNTVWYCWRISFSWWSNLALLISFCSCCCASGDILLFLH